MPYLSAVNETELASGPPPPDPGPPPQPSYNVLSSAPPPVETYNYDPTYESPMASAPPPPVAEPVADVSRETFTPAPQDQLAEQGRPAPSEVRDTATSMNRANPPPFRPVPATPGKPLIGSTGVLSDSEVPDPTPHRGPGSAQETNPDALDVIHGTAKFLSNYWPGAAGGRSLVEDMTAPYLPYDRVVERYGPQPGQAMNEAQMALPEWLGRINSIYRGLWFNTSGLNNYRDGAQYIADHSDNWMGANQRYLAGMDALPPWMDPLLPSIARVGHMINKAPGISWHPPYVPGHEPLQPDDPRLYDLTPPEDALSLEPGLYYDDPYIPGPDHGRRSF